MAKRPTPKLALVDVDAEDSGLRRPLHLSEDGQRL
jgi:hypothetical protein